MLELFTNWMDVFLKPDLPQWHNTQVMRYVHQLESQGQATAKGKGRLKTWKLTRRGLLELIEQLVEIQGFAEVRHVLLVYYFLVSYKERMVHLIEREGSGFSKTVQLELEHLLDGSRFIQQQIHALETEIERMKVRVKETREATQLAKKKKSARGVGQ